MAMAARMREKICPTAEEWVCPRIRVFRSAMRRIPKMSKKREVRMAVLTSLLSWALPARC